MCEFKLFSLFASFFHVRAFSSLKQKMSSFFSRALLFQKTWLRLMCKTLYWQIVQTLFLKGQPVCGLTHGFFFYRKKGDCWNVVDSLRRVIPTMLRAESNFSTPYSWVFMIMGTFWERYYVISYSCYVINLSDGASIFSCIGPSWGLAHKKFSRPPSLICLAKRSIILVGNVSLT